MRRLSLAVAMLLGLRSITSAELVRHDVVIADFEGADYGDWTVTGDAFGKGPARGTARRSSCRNDSRQLPRRFGIIASTCFKRDDQRVRVPRTATDQTPAEASPRDDPNEITSRSNVLAY